MSSLRTELEQAQQEKYDKVRVLLNVLLEVLNSFTKVLSLLTLVIIRINPSHAQTVTSLCEEKDGVM